MIPSPDYHEELDAMGEAEVRARLLRGEFGSRGPTREVVDIWLRMRDADRADERAQSAITRADIAIVIAIIAAIASIIAVWPVLSSWWKAFSGLAS